MLNYNHTLLPTLFFPLNGLIGNNYAPSTGNNFMWEGFDILSRTANKLSSTITEADPEKTPFLLDNEKMGTLSSVAGLVTNGANALSDYLYPNVRTGAGFNKFTAGLDTVENIAMSSGNPYAMLAGIAAKGISAGLNFTNKAFAKDTLSFNGRDETDNAAGASYNGYMKLKNKALSEAGKVGYWNGKLLGESDRDIYLYNLLASGVATIGDQTLEGKNRALFMNTWWANLLNLQNNGFNFTTGILSRKDGGNLLEDKKAKAKQSLKNGKKIKEDRNALLNAPEKFLNGGQMNVIPEGALHARLHHMEEGSPELKGQITHKGIPVVSEEGGKILQQAEVELNELILLKEVTLKLEELYKKYYAEDTKSSEKDDIAIEAGKLLSVEIMENTDDRTGLMETVE